MKYTLQIIAELGIGGAESIARDIGIYATELGYETHYIVFGDVIGEYEHELTQYGCKVFHWPSPSENYIRYLQSLKALMKQYQYDVVHAHTMFSAGWVMLAAKQCGVPVRIAHAHSKLNNGTGPIKQIYERIMRLLILQNATDLVACGEAAGIRLFGRKAYRRTGKLILNGIDTSRFAFNQDSRCLMRKKLRLEDAYVIGHTGRLDGVKNQCFLLQLMPDILERIPEARLLMLGEGEDRPVLEQQIQDLRLKDKVIMTGNVRNVQDYLNAMDVFAFPSLYEGMPLSIIEVQANGLPCVLSDRVPKDVYLTDLVHPLSLDRRKEWIDAICSEKRDKPERYAAELKTCGLDTSTVIQAYVEIYAKV